MQIGGDVVLIGVSVADAVPVSVLDPFHQRDFRVDLGLRQRLYGHLDLLERKHAAHGGKIVSRLRAVRTVEDLHRQGDGLCRLAGQRAVNIHASAVRRGRRFDHAGIAAGDDHRGVLAVDLEVARGRELNVVHHIGLIERFARYGVGEMCGQRLIQLVLVERAAVIRVRVALYRYIEHLVQHDLLIRKLEGELRGQLHLLIERLAGDHADIGLKERVRRSLLLRADGNGPVAARPLDLRPLFVVYDLGQVEILLCRLRQCHLADNLLGHGLLYLVRVPVNDDRNLDRFRFLAAGQREMRFVGVEPLCALIDRFVGVVIEVGDTADGRDRRRRLICFGVGRLCRDKFHADIGKARVGQPGLHHRLHVAVLAEPGIKGTQGFRCFFQRFLVRVDRLRGLGLNDKCDRQFSRFAVKRELRRQGNFLLALGGQGHLARRRVDHGRIAALPSDP